MQVSVSVAKFLWTVLHSSLQFAMVRPLSRRSRLPSGGPALELRSRRSARQPRKARPLWSSTNVRNAACGIFASSWANSSPPLGPSSLPPISRVCSIGAPLSPRQTSITAGAPILLLMRFRRSILALSSLSTSKRGGNEAGVRPQSPRWRTRRPSTPLQNPSGRGPGPGELPASTSASSAGHAWHNLPTSLKPCGPRPVRWRLRRRRCGCPSKVRGKRAAPSSPMAFSDRSKVVRPSRRPSTCDRKPCRPRRAISSPKEIRVLGGVGSPALSPPSPSDCGALVDRVLPRGFPAKWLTRAESPVAPRVLPSEAAAGSSQGSAASMPPLSPWNRASDDGNRARGGARVWKPVLRCLPGRTVSGLRT
mmetsp:Transcript_101114/g.286602  ORF Transcript_101114/g.286602 Transcript_101114/m.286602 type:complete len:364 (-) Transcript_101114:6-1097(-)